MEVKLTREELIQENIRLQAELESYKEDPAKIFYLQITEVIKTLSGDMDCILHPEKGMAPTLIKGDKDDKKFDQVKVLLMDTKTIFEGLKYARETIIPELKADTDKEKSEEGMSAVDRRANANKQK